LKFKRIFIAEIAAVYLTPRILFAILPGWSIDAVAEGSELSGRCRIMQQDEGPAIIEQSTDRPSGPNVKSRT
jgi:hypothetical protein